MGLSGKMTWAYAAIVALAIALAAPGLREISFTQGDDATYFTTARSLKLLLGWGWDNAGAIAAGKADIAALKARYDQSKVEFVLPYYSKPLFDLIYLGALDLWGERPQAILYANLVFFALAVWSMARVGEALFGGEIGLLAALFFATSGSALVYARTGMAHMASLALFLLGAQAFLHLGRSAGLAATRRLWAPGAIWGACLAVHPNLLPLVGLCGLADMLRGWRLYGGAVALRRAAWLAVGALAVALMVEGAYRAGGIFFEGVFALAGDWQSVPFRTYFEQLTIHADAVSDGEVTPLQKIYTYLLLFWAHEGLVACALIGLATALWFRERNDGNTLLVLVLFWVPLLFFLLSRNQAVYRYAAGIILPAALLAAIALERLLRLLPFKWPRTRPVGLAVAVFAVAAVNIAHLRPIYEVESAWTSTARWLRLHDQQGIVSTAGRTLWAANGIENIDPLHGVEGVRYLALYKRYEKKRELEVLRRHGLTTQPVFTAMHRRPDKLLEIAFLASNPVLDGLGILPGIGNFVAGMRYKVLKLNELHYIEVYELRRATDAVGERAGRGSSLGSAEETKRLG